MASRGIDNMAYHKDDADQDKNDDDDQDQDQEEYDTLKMDNDVDERRSSEEEMKGPWDVFTKENVEFSYTDEELQTTKKVLKLVAYVVTFLLLLTCAVVAKGALLFMTSQIRPNKVTPFCSYPIEYPDKHYEVTLDSREQAQWTWAIFFTFVVPEFFAFMRAARICFFKSQKRPSLETAFAVLLFETLHTVGVAMLLLIAMPELDSIKGLMLANCMSLVPAIMALMSRQWSESNRTLKMIVDVLAIVAQATGLFVWPIALRHELSGRAICAIPLGVLLASFRWWENYADVRSDNCVIARLTRIKDELKESRYYIYFFVTCWKVLAFFVCMVVIGVTEQSNAGTTAPFLRYFLTTDDRLLEVRALNNTPITFQLDSFRIIGGGLYQNEPVTPSPSVIVDTDPVHVANSAAIVVLIIQVMAAGLCYVLAKFACRICVQTVSYSLPISLANSVAICLLISLCGIRGDDVCFLRSVIPRYLFWQCPPVDSNYFTQFVGQEHGWIWTLWILSQTWIAVHVWTSKEERLANAEKLFVAPMYSGVLIEQSLLMNRRKGQDEDVQTTELQESAEVTYGTTSKNLSEGFLTNLKPTDKIPNIIACATMWHETDEEMLKMLKSVIKMDEDQSARRNAQQFFKVMDPDYYTFEAHIFFDDAFDKKYDKKRNLMSVTVNQFVKSLIVQIQEAAKKVHNQRARIAKPSVILTPYGGRLMWYLPGGNTLTAHLKDKDHIRHRKRWSQVMYMYYLLGHRIMETSMSDVRKDAISENTFLLALDGDIDFSPKAVLLLIDLMKRDLNVGAACGRIHPIGTGIMVWYQKFEYAIGHWMQKATEHVIGCVLCSPGCFSLFRAKALMAPNVMKTYTTKPTEARHYVQYDQGEDRWLCTLILQQGYRVEYSAAADAYTQCPEGFNEFYNQRRRWVPSTMANILDLLQSAKQTVIMNDNISTLYIAYQTMLIVGTILGPGTIFLMLVGAFNSAFKMDNISAFEFNMIPILLYIVICFTAKADHQILFAQILTAFYAMVMMAVIVGVALQMVDEGLNSPSTFFMVAVAASIIVSALLHPTEFGCVVYGWIYWLVIPSMYLLLMIYSLMNLNNVSWGTREIPKAADEVADQELVNVADASKKSTIMGLIETDTGSNSEGCLNINLPNLCSFMCCTHKKPNHEQFQLMKLQDTLDGIAKRLDNAERGLVDNKGLPRRRSVVHSFRSRLPQVVEEEYEPSEGVPLLDTIVQQPTDGLPTSPSAGQPPTPLVQTLLDVPMQQTFWIEDLGRMVGIRGSIAQLEVTFFEGLIEKYLHPLDEDAEKKKLISKGLLDLRNMVVFAYFMLNGLFILLLFVLQVNKDRIYMNWPIGVQTKISYAEYNDAMNRIGEITIDFEYKQLEPVGLTFVVFFAVVIFIQFIGMLIHRFGTLTHILATTSISCDKQVIEGDELVSSKEAVKIAREMQRLSGVDADNAGTMATAVAGSKDPKEAITSKRRNTIFNMAQTSRGSKPAINSLSTAFRHRFMSLKPEDERTEDPTMAFGNLNVRRGTINALIQRRGSTLYNDGSYSQGLRRQSSVGGPWPTGLFPGVDSLGNHVAIEMGKVEESDDEDDGDDQDDEDETIEYDKTFAY